MHVAPRVPIPIELAIVAQINIMFTFDNTNKNKHDSCFYEALDLEKVILSSYATYTMSWQKKFSIPLNTKFMCQNLRWKMLMSLMTLLMRH
jgi:hypothetical protein